MFNLNPGNGVSGGAVGKKGTSCCRTERTSVEGEKALVIPARLPIMRPYQHGGTRRADELAS